MLVNELKFVSYLVPTNILKVDETDSCNYIYAKFGLIMIDYFFLNLYAQQT